MRFLGFAIALIVAQIASATNLPTSKGPSTSVSDGGSQAAEVKAGRKAKECNWGFEVFKDKPSENCKKSILGKIKDEQDRIFTERIFKDWEPLNGYDIDIGDGNIQLINDAEGDYLQVQWLSLDPAIAVINGVLVVDDQKDSSFYRRMARMFQKAADAELVANVRFNKSPLELFLFGEEAQAKRKHRNRTEAENSKSEDAAYLFTVDGLTATATELVEKNSDASLSGADTRWFGANKLAGAMHNLGYLPTTWWTYAPSVSCEDDGKGRKRVGILKQEIDGKQIQIEPVKDSRTKFYVRGVPDKNATVMIDMGGSTDLKDAVEKKYIGVRRWRTWSRKLQRYVKHRKPVYKYMRYLPCDGKFNERINPSCLAAWEEMANGENDDNGEYAGIAPHIRSRLDELKAANDDKSIEFGGELNCNSENLFPAETRTKQIEACRKFLRLRFQHGKTKFGAFHEAKINKCRTSTSKKGETGMVCDGKVSDFELATNGATPSNDEKVNAQWTRMSQYMEMYKARYPDREESDICPKIARGSWNRWSSMAVDQALSYVGRRKTVNDLGKCEPPPPDAPKGLVDAFKSLGTGAATTYKEQAGSNFRDTLEKRIVGAMILSECCNDPKCVAMSARKIKVRLENGKTESAQ